MTAPGGSPARLVFLVVLLPLLAFLAAQFQIGCSQDGCPAWREVVGALLLPLLLAWLVVLGLVVRNLVRRRDHNRPPR